MVSCRIQLTDWSCWGNLPQPALPLKAPSRFFTFFLLPERRWRCVFTILLCLYCERCDSHPGILLITVGDGYASRNRTEPTLTVK